MRLRLIVTRATQRLCWRREQHQTFDRRLPGEIARQAHDGAVEEEDFPCAGSLADSPLAKHHHSAAALSENIWKYRQRHLTMPRQGGGKIARR